ncbi:hypothetical protein RhiirB3_447937 [Rhizophagus irregularis]|nr:hypothetical protein RhiirB3_447937 [Rhizophagus irregularis]
MVNTYIKDEEKVTVEEYIGDSWRNILSMHLCAIQKDEFESSKDDQEQLKKFVIESFKIVHNYELNKDGAAIDLPGDIIKKTLDRCRTFGLREPLNNKGIDNGLRDFGNGLKDLEFTANNLPFFLVAPDPPRPLELLRDCSFWTLLDHWTLFLTASGTRKPGFWTTGGKFQKF